jgi:hypothetical protein
MRLKPGSCAPGDAQREAAGPPRPIFTQRQNRDKACSCLPSLPLGDNPRGGGPAASAALVTIFPLVACACDCGKGRLRESYGELSTPAPDVVSGLTFVALSTQGAGSAERARRVERTVLTVADSRLDS